MRWDYLKLLEKQEVYWHQRAKQFWLQSGDRNTRFFHNYATTRKVNNYIQGLKDQNGEWQERESKIQDIIVEYFEELFTTSSNDEEILGVQ